MFGSSVPTRLHSDGCSEKFLRVVELRWMHTGILPGAPWPWAGSLEAWNRPSQGKIGKSGRRAAQPWHSEPRRAIEQQLQKLDPAVATPPSPWRGSWGSVASMAAL